MMKKLLLIFLISFISISNVFADENIEFNEANFDKYFSEKGYEMSQYECFNYDKDVNFDCVIFSAFDIRDNKQIELFKFENNDEAYRYFMYVYDDDENKFTNIEEYNINKDLDSNYSYLKAKLNGMRYFYMVNVDNYIIKSNTDMSNEKIMSVIYDDLGFIQLKKSSNNLIFRIVLIIISLLVIFSLIIVNLLKKKRLLKKDKNVGSI